MTQDDKDFFTELFHGVNIRLDQINAHLEAIGDSVLVKLKDWTDMTNALVAGALARQDVLEERMREILENSEMDSDE